MQRKKLLTELDENDLIEAAKDASIVETSPVYYEDSVTADVLTYLAFFGLSIGEDRVAAKLLYTVYKRWSKRKDHTAIQFNRICGMYLERQEQGNVVYFLINKSGYKLSQESQDHFISVPSKFKQNKRVGYKKNVDKFVAELGIVPGKYPFSVHALYYWYHQWTRAGFTKNRKTRKYITLKYRVFYKYLNTVIPIISTYKYGKIIQLDFTQFKGTQDEKEILRAKFWFQDNYTAIDKRTKVSGETTVKAIHKKRRKKYKARVKKVPSIGPAGESENSN